MVQVRVGSVSITGQFRENNEDKCLVDPDGRYYLVADGMGGQSAGEKASELAMTLIPQRLNQLVNFEQDPPQKVTRNINDAIQHANMEIMALGAVDPAYYNMGTTIVFLVNVAGTFYLGGVGDSRAYLLRGRKLEQLTTDHSLTQALVDAGTISKEDAANHRYRNVLYRYLGTKDGGTGADAKEITPQSGDRFLLCSDGVTDGLEDERLRELLQEHDDPQHAAEAVVDAAEQGGSRDNITCVVVYVD